MSDRIIITAIAPTNVIFVYGINLGDQMTSRACAE